MSWFNVELRGREQHCGTTPMDARADTLLAAAKMIVAINEAALSVPGSLASVAVINSTPQSINTLASRVQFNIDARARDDGVLAQLESRLKEVCEEVSAKTGVKIETWDRFWNSPRITFDERMVETVRASAKENGFKYLDLQSGAGHDSYVIRSTGRERESGHSLNSL